MNKLLLIAIFPFLLSLAACSGSELEEAMDTMGDSHKAMRDADDIESIREVLAEFSTASEIAFKQIVKEDAQADFDRGAGRIAQTVTELEAALEANDIEQAKELLVKLYDAKKHFHEKLGIEG